jgi:transcriptional regulator with XRE-family HTH domain
MVGGVLEGMAGERGLSQEFVAREVEQKYQGVRLSGPYLSMIENDIKNNLTIRLRDALLDYFNLSGQDSLFTEKEIPADIRKISRAAENMTPEQRKQWIEIAKIIAPNALGENKDK